jgi:Pyruvate/2-oxoacid:ferredoxin oxidoreductase delta subunit
MTRRPYRSLRTDGPRVGPDGTLRCRACGQYLPADAFRLTASGARGSWCKPCQVEANRQWRQEHRDAINARRRAAYGAAR